MPHKHVAQPVRPKRAHAGERFGRRAVIDVPEHVESSPWLRRVRLVTAGAFVLAMEFSVVTGPFSLFEIQLAQASPLADRTGMVEIVPGPTDVYVQEFSFAEEAKIDLERGVMTASLPEIGADADPAPGSAKAYAKAQVAKRGWSDQDYVCLVKLWNRESKWNYKAHNRGSGAYGIPQALPGRKMASAGSDWKTNPETQIDWGLGYIAGRYDTPCGAWASSQSRGWY